jgi:uncharacterized protein (DUF1800 family)
VAISNEQKALHLLNRMSYGPTQSDVTAILAKGFQGTEWWFNEQLHPEKILEPELEKKISQLKTLSMTNEQLLHAYPKLTKDLKMKSEEEIKEMGLGDGKAKEIIRELLQQKIIRSIESKKQFQEVLVDFWFNHFNVAYKKGNVKWYIYNYEKQAIRPYVFGKFKDMLMATAKSPAMMFYLDNFRSSQQMHLKGPKQEKDIGLNENYGRELLELHTLGVDGGYTQKDVQEAARILTGWTIDNVRFGGAFVFKSKRHDPGPKKVMGFSVASDQGIHEGEQLIEYLAKHPSTAKNLAKKLALKFISDNPSQKSIDEIAQVFLKTEGDLTEVYKKIFSMPEFWSEENYKSKIRDPFEYFAFVSRSLDIKFQATKEKDLKKIFQYFEQTGEPIYNCQPPTGFKMTSSNWVSAGALVSRINLSLFLAQNNSPSFDYPAENWEKSLEAKKFKNPLEVLRTLNAGHLFNQVKEETMQKISGQFSEFDLLTENHAATEHNIHYFPVKKMIGLLMSTPELQRR